MNDQEKTKLSELITKAFDGSITDQQCQSLNEIINNNRDAAIWYLEFVDMLSCFSKYGTTQVAGIEMKESPEESILDMELWSASLEHERTAPATIIPKVEPPREFIQEVACPKTPPRQVSKFSLYTLILPAAAMLLFALWLQLVPVPSPIVATLTKSVGAEWAGIKDNPVIDDVFGQGELTLVKGLAEITFDDGAVVVIEAPAVIELESPQSMFVASGKISALVSEYATGFTVNTPSASIVDLGTEFGVSVEDDGSCSLYMFKGMASLITGQEGLKKKSQTVTKGQARQVKDDGRSIRSIEFNKDTFVRWIPSPYELAVKQSRPVAYWRFEDDDQNRMINSINRNTFAGQFYGSVEYTEGPRLDNNHINKAIYLDGKGSYAVVDGIHNYNRETNAYTIMMWVRFDEIKKQYMWATNTKGIRSRYIGITDDGRFNHHTGQIDRACAMSDIQAKPNTWYHIVVTGRSYGNKIVYVNGQPSGLFDEMQNINRFRSKLIIGRKYDPLEPEKVNDYYPFAGTIDELSWYDRELSPREIKAIYQTSLSQ